MQSSAVIYEYIWISIHKQSPAVNISPNQILRAELYAFYNNAIRIPTPLHQFISMPWFCEMLCSKPIHYRFKMWSRSSSVCAQTLTKQQSRWADILWIGWNSPAPRCRPTVCGSHWPGLQLRFPAPPPLQTEQTAAVRRPAQTHTRDVLREEENFTIAGANFTMEQLQNALSRVYCKITVAPNILPMHKRLWWIWH